MNAVVYKNSLRNTILSTTGITSLVVVMLLALLIGSVGHIFGSATSVNLEIWQFVILMTFVSAFLSSQMIGSDLGQEISSESVRYTLPYVSRTTFIMSKLLANMSYWTVAMIMGFIIIGLLRHELDFLLFISLFGSIFFLVAFAMLISVSIRNSASITYFGVLYAIGMLFIYTAANVYPVWYLKLATYAFPITYVVANNWMVVILYLAGVLSVALSIFKFNRREV